jgi:hypothetical protein
MFWLTIAQERRQAFDELAEVVSGKRELPGNPMLYSVLPRTVRPAEGSQGTTPCINHAVDVSGIRLPPGSMKTNLVSFLKWDELPPGLGAWMVRWNLAVDWIAQLYLPWQVRYWKDLPNARDGRLLTGLLDMVPSVTGEEVVAGSCRIDVLGRMAKATRIFGLPLEVEEVHRRWLESAIEVEEQTSEPHPEHWLLGALPEQRPFEVVIGNVVSFRSARYIQWGEGKEEARRRIRAAFRKRTGLCVLRIVDRALTDYLQKTERAFTMESGRFTTEHFRVLARRVVPESPEGRPMTWEKASEISADGQRGADCSASVRRLAQFIGIAHS